MPTAKTLKEWVKIYEDKTGDKAEFPEGYRLCYLAERGFASMKPELEHKMMVVYQVCGDAKFWRDYAELHTAAMGGIKGVFSAIGSGKPIWDIAHAGRSSKKQRGCSNTMFPLF